MINKYFEENPTTDRYGIIPMKIALNKIIDLKSYGEISVSKLKKRGDMNLIKYFFSNETYLTNTQAFWFVIEELWMTFDLNNPYSDQWLEVFSKYDRLEGGFVDRVTLAEGKVHGKYNRDCVNNLKDRNNEITIYRGFLTRENQFVRKGIKKINNPFAEQQEEGRGLSYTTSKDVAIFFASRYHFFSDYILKKSLPSFFGKITEDSVRDEIKKMLGQSIMDSYLKKEARRTIVTCKIKTKDIIFARFQSNEFEIIADPNNVRLIRYDFINEDTKYKSIREKVNVDLNHRKITTDLEVKAFFASTMSDNDKRMLLNYTER